MDDKLKSLKGNDDRDCIPKTAGRKICASWWVFKVKGNAQGEMEHFKAQVLAKMSSQTGGQD